MRESGGLRAGSWGVGIPDPGRIGRRIPDLRGLNPGPGFWSSRACRFPTTVDPKPLDRAASDVDLNRAVDVAHDRNRGSRPPVFAGGDFIADFNPPAGQADTMADG